MSRGAGTLPLRADEGGDGLVVVGDVGLLAVGASARVVEGVGVASVRLCHTTAKHWARVLLRATPGEAGRVWYAVGVDAERTGSGVVLRTHEAGEGRGGDEEGRVEHAEARWVRWWQSIKLSAGSIA